MYGFVHGFFLCFYGPCRRVVSMSVGTQPRVFRIEYHVYAHLLVSAGLNIQVGCHTN